MAVEKIEQLPQVITPELAEGVQKALQEASNLMVQIEALNDAKKDIAATIKEKFDIPPAQFNKLAKIFHAKNLATEAAKNEEFLEFAEAIFSFDKNQLENKE